MVVTRITSGGLKLLEEMEPKLREIDGLLKPMGERKIETTLKLLDEVRAHVRREEIARSWNSDDACACLSTGIVQVDTFGLCG